MHTGCLETAVLLGVTVSGRNQEGQDVSTHMLGLELYLAGWVKINN